MNARVVKVGGAALADGAWLSGFAQRVARSPVPVVVVHGGGPDINAMAARLGLEFTWVNGRRVTSAELMDVVSMVLNGRVNKRIVAALIDAGADALGVSGEDGSLVTTTLAEGGALGRVGKVQAVRMDLLTRLLALGLVPVMSSVSRGPDGQAVNVNADEVAAAVAVALGASELLFLTDVEGVLEGGAVRSDLSAADARRMIETKQAAGGMAVKLDAAMNALAMGVTGVRIGRFDMLLNDMAGTRIRRETEVLTCL
jgi:acetylglutamate kinase